MQRFTALRDRALGGSAVAVAVALAVGLALLAAAPPSSGDLSSRANALRQSIGSDNRRIDAYQGRLADLQARLRGLEWSLAVQRSILLRIQTELVQDRHRLVLMRQDLIRDRHVLAAELVAQYESPQPDLVSVLVESHGFNDLLERVSRMKQLARSDTATVKLVARIRARVGTETNALAQAQVRQRRATAAVLVERDQVASLRLSVLEHERVVGRDRARRQAELRGIEHQLAILQARAAAAQSASFASPVLSGGGSLSQDGEWGFFPAPGTNYSVGEEPIIAARLNALGKALHLHLIGLSGYRTPQHSVEVGGFADDPHTRGEASDTPGVEGVPEATLLRFGLTRPFPGPAEADHIQLA